MTEVTQLPPPAVVVVPKRLWVPYVVEGLTSLGSNLLMVGIFFYTSHRFGWTLAQNFLLAAGQGLVYIFGALLANPMSRRFRRRPLLLGLYGLMVLLATGGAVGLPVLFVTAILILYTLLCSINWPILESLVSTGVDAHTLSRRIGIYNLVWAGTGALAIAVNGTIIEHWAPGVFVGAALVHGLGALVLAVWGGSSNRAAEGVQGASGDRQHLVEKVDNNKAGGTRAPADISAGTPPAPQKLLAVRTVALWLSRISLPATYVVIYSLMAMMPSLPIMQKLSPASQTLLSSVWMIARWLMFLVLGATIWWHTRPRLLLLAAFVMLLAFLGTTLRPGDLVAGTGTSGSIQYLWMVGWQIALGGALGLIYSGSLYFGMVLSEGSTEHGGYHEALIGLGAVLGPGAGALTQYLAPGNLWWGITAVAGLVAVTVLAATAATVALSKRG